MEIKDYLVAASIVAGERKIARLEEERSTLCGSADNVQTNLVPLTVISQFSLYLVETNRASAELL